MRWSNSAGVTFVLITLTCLGGVSWIAQGQQGTAGAGTEGSTQPQNSSSASPASAQRVFVVLIDPAHGGSDTGALITPTAAEKDITLSLARRLRQELNARGIQAQLTREGDVALSADQRAAIANTSDPALYVALHASSMGTGIRVFTSMLPAAGESKGAFLEWETAQSAALERSRLLQSQIISAILQTRFPVRGLIAPLRPLNNIKSPAIAIEISPTTGEAVQVSSTGYQQMVCAAVANAVSSLAPAMRTNAGAKQ